MLFASLLVGLFADVRVGEWGFFHNCAAVHLGNDSARKLHSHLFRSISESEKRKREGGRWRVRDGGREDNREKYRRGV